MRRCILSFSASSSRVWIQPWSLFILRSDAKWRIIAAMLPGTCGIGYKQRHQRDKGGNSGKGGGREYSSNSLKKDDAGEPFGFIQIAKSEAWHHIKVESFFDLRNTLCEWMNGRRDDWSEEVTSWCAQWRKPACPQGLWARGVWPALHPRTRPARGDGATCSPHPYHRLV